MKHSSLPQPFPQMPRLAQEKLSYCGPAVLQMLLAMHGVSRTQSQLIDAAGVAHKIETHGTLVSELSLAIEHSEPDMQFWYKVRASMADLSRLVNEFHCPVGVEWQGVFDYGEDDEEDEDDDDDDDPGHYSVITYVDTQHNTILLADPFRHYAGTDRRFSILEFERRWWDINEVIDPVTHMSQEVDDNHVMFVVVPKNVTFPQLLNMQRDY